MLQSLKSCESASSATQLWGSLPESHWDELQISLGNKAVYFRETA